MNVLFLCMSVQDKHAWLTWRPEGVLALPGTGVTDGCKLLCGCWESNWVFCQSKQVLLTDEASLQPPVK